MTAADSAGEPLLSFGEISKIYGGHNYALAQVSFDINPGEAIALVGCRVKLELHARGVAVTETGIDRDDVCIEIERREQARKREPQRNALSHCQWFVGSHEHGGVRQLRRVRDDLSCLMHELCAEDHAL